MYSGLPVTVYLKLSSPLINVEEEFGIDWVVVGLHWAQQNHANLQVSYNVSIIPRVYILLIVPMTNAEVTMISNTGANVTVPYNTLYSVSVVADFRGRQATTIIEIHYGGCTIVPY